MKHTIYYLVFLFVSLQSSCKEDNTASIEEVYIETTFQLTGELPDMLLSSSVPNNEKRDLYGIDVLHADGTPYAYGLFDEIDLAKVKLLKGEKYIFRIMVVPNGKKWCFDYSYGNYIDIFSIAFTNPGIRAAGSCPLTNEFYYHEKVHFWIFNDIEESFYYEIYAGYFPNYIAKYDNVIHFDMKRIFGSVKLQAKNLVHGKLEFQFKSDIPDNIPLSVYSTPIYTLTPTETDLSFVYSLRLWSDKNESIPDDYFFVSDYVIRWIDDDGESADLGTHSVKVQRGQETIVTLDLAELLKN